jgi:hypothetical protein
MDAEKKKPILIGIIVACLILAGGVYFMTAGGGSDPSLKRGSLIWVKCANPNCNAEYQMEKMDYYMPGGKSSSERPTCKQCNEPSLYDAIKCEKCGIVFVPGSVKNDVRDRCPECGYSKGEGTTKPVAK